MSDQREKRARRAILAGRSDVEVAALCQLPYRAVAELRADLQPEIAAEKQRRESELDAAAASVVGTVGQAATARPGIQDHGQTIAPPSSEAPGISSEAAARHAFKSQRNDAITEMFGEGATYTEIAAALEMTKNQVAGICHRLGLRRPNSRQPRSRAPAATLSAVPALGGRTCQWPMWDDKEAPTDVFCGQPTHAPGRPYCAAHEKRAWRNGTPPSRVRAP